MMNSKKSFILAAAIGILAIIPPGVAAEEVRRWGAEAASDLGRSLNRAQLLLSSGVRPSSDRSGSYQAPGDTRTGVTSFLTIAVGGVNTAMEGHRLGPSAFGLETLAHGLYSGRDVTVIPIRYGEPLPDISQLGRNVIVKVDMDLDFMKPSRPLSYVSGFPDLVHQTRWGGETVRQLSEAYKQAYPHEPVFGLGDSAGTLAITRGIEQGARLDKAILFSPQMSAGTLAETVQKHGLRPDQVLAVNGVGDLLHRGGTWDSYSHAFQHLQVKEILVDSKWMAPGHNGMIPWASGADPQAIVGGSFLSNWGLTPSAYSLSSLNHQFLFGSTINPAFSIGHSLVPPRLNFGNFPGGRWP